MSTHRMSSSMNGLNASALAACGNAEKTKSIESSNTGDIVMSASRRCGNTFAELLARGTSAGDLGDLDVRVSVQNARQLRTGVSGYVDDADTGLGHRYFSPLVLNEYWVGSVFDSILTAVDVV